MFIRPALDTASGTEGARLRVRDPDTMQFLADAGEEKPETEYWLRRLVEGGVERADAPSPFVEVGHRTKPADAEENRP